MPITTDDDLEALYAQATFSGERNPSFGFKAIGDKLVGTVQRRNIVDTPPMPGKTEKQRNLVLEVKADSPITQTRSDGSATTSEVWVLWIKAPSQMLGALREELKLKSAPNGAPKEGDRVAVEWFDSEPPNGPGRSPKKLYRWQWKGGAQPTVSSSDDLL